MPSQQLEVIVSSKIEGSGLKDAAADLENLQKESADAARAVTAATESVSTAGKKAADGIGVFTKSLGETIKYEQAFITAARAGNLAYGQTATAAARAGKAIQGIAPPLKNTQKGSVDAGFALTNLGRVASDLPFGFIAIQNNLDPLLQSFSQIFSRSQSVSEGFKAIGSSLIGAGGIGLAFSVISAAVTKAVQTYGSLGKAIDALLGKYDRMGHIIETAAKEAGGDIAQLELLRSKLTDLNAAQSERAKALQAYNKIADDANKINIKDIDNLSEINRLISQQIQLLGDRAIAAAAQKELEASASKLFEVQRKTLPILGATTKLLQDQAGVAADAAKGAKDLRIATEEEVRADGGFAAAAKADLKDVAKIRNSTEYKNAEKELREAQEAFNKILGDVADVVTFDGVSDKDTSKTKKNTKTITDVLKELELELTAVDVKTQAVGASMQDIAKDKISAFEKAIDGLLKLGVEPSSKFFSDFRKRIEEITGFLQGTSIQKEPVTVPIVAQPVFQLPKGALTKIKGLTDEFRPILNDLTKELNKLVEEAVEGAIFDLSDAIGKTLVTGDFTSIFKSFASSIGGFLQNMGKVLIATGVGLEAFKKSLETFQGVGAIIAGAALVAAGAAFRALVSNGPSFATGGGTATGPLLARIGDNPGHEEYVIPSEVLDKMNGGGPGGWKLTAAISGQQLLFLLDRTRKENRR